MPMTTTDTDLRNALPALGQNDRSFANSLLEQWGRRPLSEKQMFWVDKLVARAKGEDKPAKVAVATAQGLAPILALFEKARAHLKAPAVEISSQGAGEVRLWIATERAAQPGTVSLVDGEREWLGRIGKDGMFEPSRKISAGRVTEVGALLSRFAADPAGVASEHGRLTGRCSFCSRKLSDERSTDVGYGPVCADRYGLAWG